MEEKRLNGCCLYTPNGAAREYAAVGCNFYRGCPYQCRYCYNRKGMTAKVMGVDHAMLENEFTKVESRPKKYRDLTSEEYAFVRFQQAVFKWQDYLRKTGIFFSFSTDPLCDDAFGLTWQCVRYATKEYGIPVKILTKNADFSAQQMLWFDMIPMERRKLIAFGFTLTGRDEWEPFASKNIERVRLMRVLYEMGYHTFASIEPIVDFVSSYEMIVKSVKFCDQFLIGLMSSRQANGLPPYAEDECAKFVLKVHALLTTENTGKSLQDRVYVYWKESVRKFMSENNAVITAMNEFSDSVSRDWSLFAKSEIKL